MSPAIHAHLRGMADAIGQIYSIYGEVPTLALFLTPTGHDGMDGSDECDWFNPAKRGEAIRELRRITADKLAHAVLACCPDWRSTDGPAVLIYAEVRGASWAATVPVRDNEQVQFAMMDGTDSPFHPLLPDNGALAVAS